MIRWLYKHSKAFRVRVNKLLHYNQQVKPDMEFAFIDSNGKRYNRYKDDLNMPMVRKGAINHFMALLTAAITETELSEYVMILKACHEKMLETRSLEAEAFSKMGYVLSELEAREKLHIHPELCFDLCAVVYIREDEIETATYNDNIHNEKVEQFKKDSREGLYDFFTMSGWQTYLPYSATSQSELKAYVESIKPTLEAQKKMRSNLITSLGLSPKEKVS